MHGRKTRENVQLSFCARRMHNVTYKHKKLESDRDSREQNHIKIIKSEIKEVSEVNSIYTEKSALKILLPFLTKISNATRNVIYIPSEGNSNDTKIKLEHLVMDLIMMKIE